MDYTYTLEKYAGIKSRHVCPSCNQRSQFTRYINAATGEYLADHVGRCNREDQCGYHYTPHQYFSDNPRSRPATRTVSHPRRETTPSTFDTVPFEVVKKSLVLLPKSNFHAFLSSKFGENACSDVAQKFLFATSETERGATIFWQYDITGKVRSGKIIHYNPLTGKRGKNINWVHSKISKHTGKPFQLRQCFFGEHQLVKDANKSVALVESEKTAVICSIFMPDYLWIASGGVNGCRWHDKNVASALLGRDVILFPDLNMYERWGQYASELQKLLPLRLKVSDLLERVATQSEREEKSGFDLADYLLKQPSESNFEVSH